MYLFRFSVFLQQFYVYELNKRNEFGFIFKF